MDPIRDLRLTSDEGLYRWSGQNRSLIERTERFVVRHAGRANSDAE